MSPEASDSIILLFSDAMRHLYPEAGLLICLPSLAHMCFWCSSILYRTID